MQSTTYPKLKLAVRADVTNIGYLLGRYFCCYELLRGTRDPHMYGQLLSCPADYFGECAHKLAHCVRESDICNKIDATINDIASMLPHDLPRKLSGDEESAYGVGYYHQHYDLLVNGI